ncbi:hypothetical protein [Bifidobacterium gallicum]|nr:hypothetical protein [Bifidobacterium gallicum]KFI59663.1 hypothetical protein BGLCM_0332 [Bifidobacterium gallicum DSM 20093 = LMG 11596]
MVDSNNEQREAAIDAQTSSSQESLTIPSDQSKDSAMNQNTHNDIVRNEALENDTVETETMMIIDNGDATDADTEIIMETTIVTEPLEQADGNDGEQTTQLMGVDETSTIQPEACEPQGQSVQAEAHNQGAQAEAQPTQPSAPPTWQTQPAQSVPVYQVAAPQQEPRVIQPQGASAGTIVLAIIMLVIGGLGVWVAVQFPSGVNWIGNIDHLGVWMLAGLGVILIIGAIAVAITHGMRERADAETNPANR